MKIVISRIISVSMCLGQHINIHLTTQSLNRTPRQQCQNQTRITKELCIKLLRHHPPTQCRQIAVTSPLYRSGQRTMGRFRYKKSENAVLPFKEAHAMRYVRPFTVRPKRAPFHILLLILLPLLALFFLLRIFLQEIWRSQNSIALKGNFEYSWSSRWSFVSRSAGRSVGWPVGRLSGRSSVLGRSSLVSQSLVFGRRSSVGRLSVGWSVRRSVGRSEGWIDGTFPISSILLKYAHTKRIQGMM